MSRVAPAVALAVLAVGGCSKVTNSVREVAGVGPSSDPSVNLKSAETRWLLIKNPRFGDVPSEPEYVWVEEDKVPLTMKTFVLGKGSIIAPPEIVAKYGSPPGGGRISPRQGGPSPVTDTQTRQPAGATGAAVVAFAIWTHVEASDTFFLNPVELLTILSVIAAVWLVYEHREGFAFAATTITMASSIVSIFVGLYPNVMVSSTSAAYNLTVHNTASGGYSLKAMTVVVIIFMPLVLAYQTWSYYVFRRRISTREFQPPAQRSTPVSTHRPSTAAPDAAAPPASQGT